MPEPVTTINIERANDGGWCVSSPDLPGVIVLGAPSPDTALKVWLADVRELTAAGLAALSGQAERPAYDA